MTRPMPGPPDARHVFYSFPHTHPDDALGGCPKCFVDSRGERESVAKRLTDAECAAEYWRAEAEVLYFDPDDEPRQWSAAVTRQDVINRFATSPHAFKENRP